jgi:hypothetical protein
VVSQEQIRMGIMGFIGLLGKTEAERLLLPVEILRIGDQIRHQVMELIPDLHKETIHPAIQNPEPQQTHHTIGKIIQKASIKV